MSVQEIKNQLQQEFNREISLYTNNPITSEVLRDIFNEDWFERNALICAEKQSSEYHDFAKLLRFKGYRTTSIFITFEYIISIAGKDLFGAIETYKTKIRDSSSFCEALFELNMLVLYKQAGFHISPDYYTKTGKKKKNVEAKITKEELSFLIECKLLDESLKFKDIRKQAREQVEKRLQEVRKRLPESKSNQVSSDSYPLPKDERIKETLNRISKKLNNLTEPCIGMIYIVPTANLINCKKVIENLLKDSKKYKPISQIILVETIFPTLGEVEGFTSPPGASLYYKMHSIINPNNSVQYKFEYSDGKISLLDLDKK